MPQSPKKVRRYVPYDSAYILDMSDEFVELLNSMGGLRMFSSGDYFVEIKGDIEKILTDAKKRGLKIKAITKQEDFITEFLPRFTNPI